MPTKRKRKDETNLNSSSDQAKELEKKFRDSTTSENKKQKLEEEQTKSEKESDTDTLGEPSKKGKGKGKEKVQQKDQEEEEEKEREADRQYEKNIQQILRETSHNPYGASSSKTIYTDAAATSTENNSSVGDAGEYSNGASEVFTASTGAHNVPSTLVEGELIDITTLAAELVNVQASIDKKFFEEYEVLYQLIIATQEEQLVEPFALKDADPFNFVIKSWDYAVRNHHHLMLAYLLKFYPHYNLLMLPIIEHVVTALRYAIIQKDDALIQFLLNSIQGLGTFMDDLPHHPYNTELLFVIEQYNIEHFEAILPYFLSLYLKTEHTLETNESDDYRFSLAAEYIRTPFVQVLERITALGDSERIQKILETLLDHLVLQLSINNQFKFIYEVCMRALLKFFIVKNTFPLVMSFIKDNLNNELITSVLQEIYLGYEQTQSVQLNSIADQNHYQTFENILQLLTEKSKQEELPEVLQNIATALHQKMDSKRKMDKGEEMLNEEDNEDSLLPHIWTLPWLQEVNLIFSKFKVEMHSYIRPLVE